MTLFRVVLMLFLCLGTPHLKAQIFVYPNERMSFFEMICHIEDGLLLPQASTFQSEARYTARDGSVFKGWSTSPFDVMYTIRNGKVYAGESSFSSDIVLTIKDDRVYQGDSDFDLDLLFTLRHDGLYQGNSVVVFDRICFIDGDPTPEELFMILLALEQH